MESAVEKIVRQFNSSYFLKEFTFFPKEIPKSKAKRELTDGLIWLGDKAVFFQIKERGKLQKEPSEDKQRKWFEKNVIGIAVEQMMGSLRSFESLKKVGLKNLRGQNLTIDFNTIKTKQYVVIYHSYPYSFPRECLARKSYLVDGTGEFIHIIKADDWQMICMKLETPAEITEYLKHREMRLRTLRHCRKESEKWLVGRFIKSPELVTVELDGKPIDYEGIINSLQKSETPFFDFLAKNLYNYIETTSAKGSLDYVEILLEFALMNRGGRVFFNQKFKTILEHAFNKKFYIDRLVYTRDENKIGWVFISNPEAKTREERLEWLEYVVKLHHYEQRTDKCAGACVFSESETAYQIEWAIDPKPFEDDERMEIAVKKAYEDGTLVPLETKEFDIYRFSR